MIALCLIWFITVSKRYLLSNLKRNIHVCLSNVDVIDLLKRGVNTISIDMANHNSKNCYSYDEKISRDEDSRAHWSRERKGGGP